MHLVKYDGLTSVTSSRPGLLPAKSEKRCYVLRLWPFAVSQPDYLVLVKEPGPCGRPAPCGVGSGTRSGDKNGPTSCRAAPCDTSEGCLSTLFSSHDLALCRQSRSFFLVSERAG